MSQINLNQICKSYKNRVLFHNMNFTVDKGRCVGIVGSNGTGKSVLFKLITGIETPDKGEVWVNNQRIGYEVDFPSEVGILVNQPGYIEYYSGFKNLKLLAEIKNIIDDQVIREYMKLVGLNPNDKTLVKNYSSGMKQKLGIAQAIMEDQTIILLDEPFNALDIQTNRDIISVLRTLKEEGKTILLTSHQHNYLEKICDDLFIITEQNILELDDKLKEEYFSI